MHAGAALASAGLGLAHAMAQALGGALRASRTAR
jgi:alcohol dehydrogenase class IV